jgi:hypothetical protein
MIAFGCLPQLRWAPGIAGVTGGLGLERESAPDAVPTSRRVTRVSRRCAELENALVMGSLTEWRWRESNTPLSRHLTLVSSRFHRASPSWHLVVRCGAHDVDVAFSRHDVAPDAVILYSQRRTSRDVVGSRLRTATATAGDQGGRGSVVVAYARTCKGLCSGAYRAVPRYNRDSQIMEPATQRPPRPT